jgi:hypothetical protein
VTPTAVILAALLALNMTWLFGFGSFLLGACLFALTLGAWWSGRDAGWSPRRAWVLAGLSVLGYFCHMVSLGLTVVGLAVLEAATPGRPDAGAEARAGRAATTAAGLVPLAPLGLLYLRLMRRGGAIAPQWKHLGNVLSPRSWLSQLMWADPITLARKDYLPLAGTFAAWHMVLAPAVWVAVGLVLAALATFAAGLGPLRDRQRRGWWVLGAVLLVGGVAAPDTIGPSHGEYLQQRIVLLGLVALVPVLRLAGAGRLAGAATLALVVALAVQLAVVCDYGAVSERTAGALVRATGLVGRDQRIATRMTGIRTPFRANPLYHADCTLGVGTGNIVWGDYETRFYYFPVQFRPGLDRPDPEQLEWIAKSEAPDEVALRLALWTEILERHHESIDVVVGWNDDPPLDAVTLRWFPNRRTRGAVRVFRRD